MKAKVRLRKFTAKVYIRMGAVFFVFVFLEVVNSSEIVLWYQFCLPLLYSEVGVYNVLNSLTLITLIHRLKLVAVHVFCLVISHFPL